MNRGWISLGWGEDRAPNAPTAMLSLACQGDMRLKPRPAAIVLEETARLFPSRRFVWLRQEHTRVVLRSGAGDAAAGLAGDGLVTDDPQTLLGVSVADCMPVFLWDTAGGGRALLHSGWKGTGIAREALKLMKASYGSRPENIRALLGPSIRSCCYAVPQERARSFAEEFGEDAAVFRDGAWRLDLVAANTKILKAEGVLGVFAYPACTCCDARFSSYRRQGKGGYTCMLALCAPWQAEGRRGRHNTI
ncbi:MAG: polyphenol oxidase family protein [Spirochaetia bacterium]|nr:polyphenol oxidase family protein [Spirochaetia bacterium]